MQDLMNARFDEVPKEGLFFYGLSEETLFSAKFVKIQFKLLMIDKSWRNFVLEDRYFYLRRVNPFSNKTRLFLLSTGALPKLTITILIGHPVLSGHLRNPQG